MVPKEYIAGTPTMYPGCIEVSKQIEECRETREFLTQYNLDDIVVSWTGTFLHSVYHEFKNLRRNGNQNWNNSMLFCGLSSQAMQLDWLIYSARFGQYDLAVRELRNMLESAFLFYRSDNDSSFRGKTLEEKFEQLKKLPRKENHGKPVFQNSGYSDWQKVYKLYKKLCRYTHTRISLDNARQLFEDFNDCSSPTFDEKRFLECVRYIQKVIVIECRLMESVLKEVYGVEDAEYASIFNGH